MRQSARQRPILRCKPREKNPLEPCAMLQLFVSGQSCLPAHRHLDARHPPPKREFRSSDSGPSWRHIFVLYDLRAKAVLLCVGPYVIFGCEGLADPDVFAIESEGHWLLRHVSGFQARHRYDHLAQHKVINWYCSDSVPVRTVASGRTAATQSMSMSKCPGQAGTQMKIRAGGSFGKKRT
jgi:hypothetical protein